MSQITIGNLEDYFDLDAIRDPSGLEVTIQQNTLEQSRIYPERKIRVIILTFTSQIWHKGVWTHKARIYIPDSYNFHGNVGIIGTHRLFTPEDNYKMGEAEHFKRGTLYKTDIMAEPEFPFIIQNWGQQYVDSALVTMIFSTTPIWAMLIGITFGNEPLTWQLLVGGCFIFSGIILFLLNEQKKPLQLENGVYPQKPA